MTNVERSTISHGDVTLAVSEMGQGQTLVFFNGGGATQVSWKRIIGALKGTYRIITFDFRNHGKSSRSSHVALDDFLGDAEVVMDKFAGPNPIVIGWSLGTDVAVWYAATHPGRVAGLFLLDGAVPVNLVTDADATRRALHSPAVRYGPKLLSLVGRGYQLSPDEYADMTIDLNVRREHLLPAYQRLTCPMELYLATKTAGVKRVDSEKKNAMWRAGGEQLARLRPEFTVRWFDGSHLLPYTESATLAHNLDAFARRVQADSQGESR